METTIADPFELAEGMVKQLLTLATGSIGGIIVLFDDKEQPGVQLAPSWWLVSAMVLLAISVIAGLFTLGGLTSELADNGKDADINAGHVRGWAQVQMIAFALGVIAVAAEVVQLKFTWAVLVPAVSLVIALKVWRERANEKRKKAET